MNKTDETYLKDLLSSQTLKDDSAEMNNLRDQREEVEKIIKESFPTAKIRYGGSKAKGTLLKMSYDLDIVCYFPHDETEAGTTLKELYQNVSTTLSKNFLVDPKTSALRLLSSNPDTKGTNTHIDVVPGRYTDATNSDCYLYQNGAEKERLKTNLDMHIAHIKNSGVTDALKLLKLWRVQNSVPVKQFAFELLGVEILKNKKTLNLPDQVRYFFKTISESTNPIKIEDPANPTGNDLMPMLNENWNTLRHLSQQTLHAIENTGWETVYGEIPPTDNTEFHEQLTTAIHVAKQTNPTQPWTT